MATKHKQQSEGTQIFFAQRAAERLLHRTDAERGAVMSMSRDELSTLARQMMAVARIAERHHLERATAASLPPDAFPEPVE